MTGEIFIATYEDIAQAAPGMIQAELAINNTHMDYQEKFALDSIEKGNET